MAPTDPHQGGNLSDMAVDGTSMPNDAGRMNLIPSVPRPGEDEGEDSGSVPANRSSLAGAASNATDIPRGVQDISATGEVETGTGDQLPAQVESKRLHYGANDPVAKGHDRVDKHEKQKESDLERYAKEGGGVDKAPGEENLDDEQVTGKFERKEV